MIRDCSNFRGLQSGYYRIAVKSEEQNRIFAEVLREIHGNAQAVERIDRMKEKSEERIDRVKEQIDMTKGQESTGENGTTAQLVHKTGAVEFSRWERSRGAVLQLLQKNWKNAVL